MRVPDFHRLGFRPFFKVHLFDQAQIENLDMDQFSCPTVEIENMVSRLRHEHFIDKAVQPLIADIKIPGVTMRPNHPEGFGACFEKKVKNRIASAILCPVVFHLSGGLFRQFM